jgi:hypothetical protein
MSLVDVEKEKSAMTMIVQQNGSNVLALVHNQRP